MTTTLDPVDGYATEDTGTSEAPAPADVPTGKFYQVNVPAYQTSTHYPSNAADPIPNVEPSTYVRLGSGATDDDPRSLIARALYHLDPNAVPPQSAHKRDAAHQAATNLTKKNGGHREHTDGDRIITTYGDHYNIVGGSYYNVITSQLSWDNANLPWASADEPPDGGYRVDTDGEVNNCLCCDYYYDVTSTQAFPIGGQSPYGEPVLTHAQYANYWRLQDAPAPGTANQWDSNDNEIPVFYEYVNSDSVRSTTCAESSHAEKLFAGKALSVVCTRYGDDGHTHSEKNDFADWSDGDLMDRLCTRNYKEVVTADGAITSVSTAGAAISETRTSAGGIVDMTVAGLAIGDTRIATHGIVDVAVAGGAIADLQASVLGMMGVKAAGIGIMDVTAAMGAVIDIKLALGAMVEVTQVKGKRYVYETEASVEKKSGATAITEKKKEFAKEVQEIIDEKLELYADKTEINLRVKAINQNVNNIAAVYNRLHKKSQFVVEDLKIL